MTKLALITGASRGFGAAVAEALAPEHHVVAVARTTGALEELDDRIQAKGGQATLALMDLFRQPTIAALAEQLVVSTAATEPDDIEPMSEDELALLMEFDDD